MVAQKRPAEAAAGPASAAPEREEDFPRGGGGALSALARRQARFVLASQQLQYLFDCAAAGLEGQLLHHPTAPQECQKDMPLRWSRPSQASAGCFGRLPTYTINMGGPVSNATISNDTNDMPVG